MYRYALSLRHLVGQEGVEPRAEAHFKEAKRDLRTTQSVQTLRQSHTYIYV